jgi:hypothetical protein
MATTENPSDNLIEIEIDNFVSPNAANDAANDDSLPLELDGPIPAALASEPAADVQPTTELTDIATTVQTSETTATPGSVRMGGYVQPDARGASFDDSALTPTEIARREENRARSAEHAARMRAIAARENAPTPAMPGTNNPDAVILPAIVATITTDDRAAGLKLAWNPAESKGGFEIARDTIVAHLTAHGMADLAPGIPASRGQFGKVMKEFNSVQSREDRDENTRLWAKPVTRREYEQQGKIWPTALESRYVVGVLDTTDNLGTMGEKEMIVSLVETMPDSKQYEIQFTGGSDRLRSAVMARFSHLIGTAAFNVTTTLKWYQDTLVKHFDAIRCGYAMLIVDNGSDDAAKRIARAEAFTNVLQGENPYEASEIMGRRLAPERVVSRSGYTWQNFCTTLGAGMMDDIKDLGKEFAKEYALAQAAARDTESARPDATPESIELAGRRALIGSERANGKHNRLLGSINALQARATALVEVIGRAHATPAISACEALRAEWSGKCYAVSALEIELD